MVILHEMDPSCDGSCGKFWTLIRPMYTLYNIILYVYVYIPCACVDVDTELYLQLYLYSYLLAYICIYTYLCV
jgi:hypothetical protein